MSTSCISANSTLLSDGLEGWIDGFLQQAVTLTTPLQTSELLRQLLELFILGTVVLLCILLIFDFALFGTPGEWNPLIRSSIQICLKDS